MLNSTDTNKFIKLLQERKESLLSLIDERSDESKPVTLDQQSVGRLSRMDALQVQAMAQETARRREQELQKITYALKRIEDGDFGFCVQCDEEISLQRLQLDPSTTTCINCAGNHQTK